MPRTILFIILAAETVALLNRGGGPFTSHLALTLATAAIAVVWFLQRRKQHISSTVAAPLAIGSYAIFCLFFIISLFFSRTPAFGLNELLLFLNTAILLMVFASLKLDERKTHLFAWGVLALVTAEALAGFYFYVTLPFPRMAGTFLALSEPQNAAVNAFANVLLGVLPIAYWHLVGKHARKTTTILAILATAILLSAFLLSFSRAAWLSLIGVLLVGFSWRVFKRRNKAHTVGAENLCLSPRQIAQRVFAVLIFTIIFAALLQNARSSTFQTESIVDKLLFRADEGSASAGERMDYWRAAMRLIPERPLIGNGVRSFRYLFPPLQEKFGIVEDHPHNIFLKIAFENGLFALAAYLIFIAAAAIAIINFVRRNRVGVAAFFSLAALGMFAHNLLDFNFVTSNYLLFMSFIGIAFTFMNGTNASAQKFKLPLSIPIFIVVGALVLLAAHETYYNVHFKKGRQMLEQKRFLEAINTLEKAEPLLFDRDLSLYLARAYRAVRSEKQKALLEKTIEKNPLDAEAYGLLAEVYFIDGDVQSARENFEKALALDPRNTLKYYYWLFVVYRQLDISSAELKKRTAVLLDEYKTALSRNEHFTVLTDNPVYASRLYGELGLLKEMDEFDKLWLKEIEKYSLRYGEL